MAVSEQGGIITDNLNIQEDIWSLGCDISIENVDATIQEIRLSDIVLSGMISIDGISVDLDASQKNVFDLDILISSFASCLKENPLSPLSI